MSKSTYERLFEVADKMPEDIKREMWAEMLACIPEPCYDPNRQEYIPVRRSISEDDWKGIQRRATFWKEKIQPVLDRLATQQEQHPA